MTKKEAREFVEDDSSWKTLEIGQVIRTSMLTFKEKKWIKYEAPAVDSIDVWRGKENPRRYWRKIGIYEYDPVNNAVGPDTSITHLANEIWNQEKEHAGND
jgi:hypothetical protein